MKTFAVFELDIPATPEGLVEYDDGRRAMIIELDGEDEVFVRLQSWDDEKKHPRLSSLIGKKIRVTVEVEE